MKPTASVFVPRGVESSEQRSQGQRSQKSQGQQRPQSQQKPQGQSGPQGQQKPSQGKVPQIPKENKEDLVMSPKQAYNPDTSLLDDLHGSVMRIKSENRIKIHTVYDDDKIIKSMMILEDELCTFITEDDGEYVISNQDQKVVLRCLMIMDNIKMSTKHYPWTGCYLYCPILLYKYLKVEGLTPEVRSDIREFIQTAISMGDEFFPWKTFHSLLEKDMEGNRDDSCYKDEFKELFIKNVHPKGYGILMDAKALGYIDHRLDYAIIVIQRLIKFRNFGTEGTFEKSGNYPKPNHPLVRPKNIGILTQSEVARGSMRTEIEEHSFLKWNVQLYPEIFSLSLIGSYKFNNYSIVYSYHDLLNIKDLYEMKMSLLSDRLAPHIDNYDKVFKLVMLLEYNHVGILKLWRHSHRDKLKFNNYSLQLGDVGGHLVKKIMAYPPTEVFYCISILPEYLPSRGKALIKEFSELNLFRLTINELKYWFNILIVGDLEEIIDSGGLPITTDINKEGLQSFLCSTEIYESLICNIKKEYYVLFCLDHLLKLKHKLKNKDPVYYSPWSYYEIITNEVKLE